MVIDNFEVKMGYLAWSRELNLSIGIRVFLWRDMLMIVQEL